MSKKSERNQEQQQGKTDKGYKGQLPSVVDRAIERGGAHAGRVENPVLHVRARQDENPEDDAREGR